MISIIPADGEKDPVGGPAPDQIKAVIWWGDDAEVAYQAFLKQNPPANDAMPPTRLTFLSVVFTSLDSH